STYLPANGFSITAMAAARLVGGAMVFPISRCVSSTTVTILRITALILSASFPINHASHSLARDCEAPAIGGPRPFALPRQRSRPAIAARRLRSIRRRAIRARTGYPLQALPRSRDLTIHRQHG